MASRIATVITRLREMILAGELTPGERLREVPFAQRLGVSRTPLRIALGELEKEGLLERLPTRGFRSGAAGSAARPEALAVWPAATAEPAPLHGHRARAAGRRVPAGVAAAARYP
jgi:DNA-binding FadR family transcriptional regulator